MTRTSSTEKSLSLSPSIDSKDLNEETILITWFKRKGKMMNYEQSDKVYCFFSTKKLMSCWSSGEKMSHRHYATQNSILVGKDSLHCLSFRQKSETTFFYQKYQCVVIRFWMKNWRQSLGGLDYCSLALQNMCCHGKKIMNWIEVRSLKAESNMLMRVCLLSTTITTIQRFRLHILKWVRRLTWLVT